MQYRRVDGATTAFLPALDRKGFIVTKAQPAEADHRSDAAAVVIGRNEGKRLEACLKSLAPHFDIVVYVDSGSRDDSLELADRMGAITVSLDASRPYTAARGRNAGAAEALRRRPTISHVQFIDGDSVMEPFWPELAVRYLATHPDVGIVCGLLHERDRNASTYNLLCDIEWDRSPGPQSAVGGIQLTRVDAYRAANGFRDDIPAAEDDDFSIRVRRAGWRIECIPVPMAIHDADMHRLSQWWRRAVRAGQGFAQIRSIHPAHFGQRPARMLAWAALLPVALVAMISAPSLGILLLLAYPASWARNVLRALARGLTMREAAISSWFLLLSNFPGAIGILLFHCRRLQKNPPQFIEHKTSS